VTAESGKLNGLNPKHYLADILARIADHPALRSAEPLPWNCQPGELNRDAAFSARALPPDVARTALARETRQGYWSSQRSSKRQPL
jgi:hypothetical protein